MSGALRLKLYRGKWAAVWLDPSGRTRRASLRTADRGLAEQRLADLERAPLGDGVAEIFEAWCKDLAARGKSRARADDAWKALRGPFAGLRPDQVDRPRCRAYLRQRRAQGRADGTIGKELDLLRSALRWADRNTPATIEGPPRPAPRHRHLTRAEYRALRLAAKRVAPHIWLFVVLALATAARKQALLELTWDRVDLGAGRVVLSRAAEPNRKARATLPITRNARRALALARRYALGDHVIEYAGRPLGSVKRGFASACAAAGLEAVTPHTLRHTAAVWMAEAGVPMSAIAQYLGHADSRITERVYARYSPDYLAGAAAALG